VRLYVIQKLLDVTLHDKNIIIQDKIAHDKLL